MGDNEQQERPKVTIYFPTPLPVLISADDLTKIITIEMPNGKKYSLKQVLKAIATTPDVIETHIRLFGDSE